jgi:tetratricopeptide (TPR) repeat protein
MGNMVDALRELTDALEDARAFGVPSLVALCLSNLGELHYASEDIDAADALFNEAAGLASGDGAVAALVSHNRGVVAMARGEYSVAQALILKSAAANEKSERWIELASNRYTLASIANALGDEDKAISWAQKALEADKRAEHAPGIGADLEALARLQRKATNEAAAFDLYRRALGVWLSLDREGEAERCLIALQELASSLGKEDYASRYEALLGRLDDR